MATSLDQMLPLLRCPRTGAPLIRSSDGLITQAGVEYPIVNGKPILVRNILPMHTTPPDARVVSQNTATFELGPEFAGREIVALHLGSGNVPSSDPRIISMDVLPNENVDIVAEAEALPFATCSLDFVASGAVFEHVYDPIKSAEEVRRVLKEGGTFYIDTAFMQGYHGFPGHYFNMTPQAAETYIVDDFILEGSGAPFAAGALHPVYHGFRFLLEQLSEAERDEILRRSLGEVLDSIKDTTPPEPFARRNHEAILRSLGASIAVRARKPVGYDPKRRDAESELGSDKWAALKRDYYTARMGVIREHGGLKYWRMRAVEDRACSAEGVAQEPPLESILTNGLVTEPMVVQAWRDAIDQLNSQREALIAIRDSWIGRFLSMENRSHNRT